MTLKEEFCPATPAKGLNVRTAPAAARRGGLPGVSPRSRAEVDKYGMEANDKTITEALAALEPKP